MKNFLIEEVPFCLWIDVLDLKRSPIDGSVQVVSRHGKIGNDDRAKIYKRFKNIAHRAPQGAKMHFTCLIAKLDPEQYQELDYDLMIIALSEHDGVMMNDLPSMHMFSQVIGAGMPFLSAVPICCDSIDDMPWLTQMCGQLTKKGVIPTYRQRNIELKSIEEALYV
jgi:hypothetical protein